MVLIKKSVVTLYLTKTENRTKKSVTQLSHHSFEQRQYFCQKKMLNFAPKNVDISKIKGALVLKAIFSETIYMCVFTYQIPCSTILLTSFKRVRGSDFVPSPTSKRTPKKPTQIRVKINKKNGQQSSCFMQTWFPLSRKLIAEGCESISVLTFGFNN